MKRWKWALCLIFTMLLMIVWTGCGEHVTVDPHPPTKSVPPSAAQNPPATTTQTTPPNQQTQLAPDAPAITPLANTDLPSRIYFQSIAFWDTSNGAHESVDGGKNWKPFSNLALLIRSLFRQKSRSLPGGNGFSA